MENLKDILHEIDTLQEQVKAIRPLSKKQTTELRHYYKIGLTYASNALEGNSLTETETRIAIEDGITVAGKPLKDYYEAEGHALAYDKMIQLVKKETLNEKDIKALHRLFYQKIDPKDAGKYRKIRVFISGSAYKLPAPESVTKLMKDFCTHINKEIKDMHPVIQAALAHKDFVFIHPFVDGNGRVARLIMNTILLRNGYPVTLIPPVYRLEYINALEKAHTNDEPFINFIAGCVRQAQWEYIKLLKD